MKIKEIATELDSPMDKLGENEMLNEEKAKKIEMPLLWMNQARAKSQCQTAMTAIMCKFVYMFV